MAEIVTSKQRIFLNALKANDMEKITEMIQTDPTFDHQFMLRHACFYGKLDIVELLLQDPRVDPSVEDNTPIKFASQTGDTDMVKRLLQDPRVDPSADQQFALMAACKNDHTEIVKMLLQDPRINPSVDDQSLIRNACMYGQTEIVRVLLQDPRVDPSVNNQTCLKWAVGTKNIELVRLLLQDARIDPSKDEQNILKMVIEKGYVEVLEILLQDPRVDPSINDQHLLKDTIQKGRNRIVQILLKDRRVDPSVDDQWALRTAVGSNDAQLLEILFTDDRVNPTIRNNLLLIKIAELGYTRLMRLFLKHPRVDPAINNQLFLRIAIANGHVETVRELLMDERVDPSIKINEKEQGILSITIDIGDPNMIKLLLLDPRVDPTINHQFAIRQAAALGTLSTVQAVLQDPRVDPTVSGPGPDQPSAIENACLLAHIDIITILLADPRVKNSTIFEMAKNGKFHPRINELVLSFQPDTPWEGFSKGDMEKFDSIFSEEANDYSCCPVCMRYVQRVDGCMYMSHNCYAEPGANTVDDYWYNMYKNREGKIFWCTICGRICLGHRHYKLGATKDKLELVPLQASADPFAKDCKGEGGGGITEKMMRFNAFRNLAYELQKEVGKMPRKRALEELVADMWSAPMSALSFRRARNNLVAKKFRLPSNAFPAPVASNNAPNIVRNAQNAALLPTLGPGYNAIGGTDDDVVIQFHHRQKNGEVNDHNEDGQKIGVDSFQVYIQSNLNDGKAGSCWHKDCTAIIHPDEIKELVRLDKFPEDLYKRYKDAFNRVQRGGGGDILQEATTAQCVIWEEKGGRKTRRNRKNRRNTRKYK